MKKAKLLTVLCLSVQLLTAQERLSAFEMNKRLGRGINIGNSFEAPSETAWGNPWKPEYFKIISQLGFSHVRLPVRWEPSDRSGAESPYTINPAFLDRIQQVVDTALRHNLHIIVNMHHHEALYENPAAQKARFVSQWFQIANRFKHHPDKLLFEVLNEPHGNLTPQLWNEYFNDALAEIRKTNPTRIVLMGVAEYGGLGGISQLQLPNDEYIILSPHYYNPFNFTHQGAEWVTGADAWLGTEWNDTEADRATVDSDFSHALQFSEANHIPIHVGEFGAYSKADLESRVRWTNFLARWFEEKKMSWAYWEFSAGFGIYDPASKVMNIPLADALLHNEMPAPTPIAVTPIYTSNFSGGTDGWVLFNQGGASSNLSSSGGELNIAISNGGTESWHVQLVKPNIPLQQKRLYRISFKAHATAETITVYAGNASNPWNAYSGFNNVSVTAVAAEYSFSFTMNNITDMNSRLVFDLGKNSSGVSISEVKVEELKLLITGIDKPERAAQITTYPNPVGDALHIKTPCPYRTAELVGMDGKRWAKFVLDDNTDTVSLENIPSGQYLFKLAGNGVYDCLRVRVAKE
jgi:endoglucanase